VHRATTERWGPVLVSLAVEITEQVVARPIVEEREARRLRLEQAIAAVPQPTLSESATEVAQALVPAFSVEMCVLRLLDPGGDLHLVAAAGFGSSEVTRIALNPISASRIEAIRAKAEEHPFAAAFALRYLDVRWLRFGDTPIGTLSVATRTDRRPSQEESLLLDALATQLAEKLSQVDRSSARLRALSLKIGRDAAEAGNAGDGRLAVLTRRQRAILGLYAEGLDTREISEFLVLSPHTVRTHVKLALRRLGVTSRKHAVHMLNNAADSHPML
jgi:DNA-binding CsgD family transcriptional regulator